MKRSAEIITKKKVKNSNRNSHRFDSDYYIVEIFRRSFRMSRFFELGSRMLSYICNAAIHAMLFRVRINRYVYVDYRRVKTYHNKFNHVLI